MSTLYIVYDCQTLLDLCFSAVNLVKYDHGHKTLPLFLSGVPAYLCRTPAPTPRRKRHRGKRSGRLVRMKEYSACPISRTECRAVPRLSLPRRYLDPVDAWLVPVIVPSGAG